MTDQTAPPLEQIVATDKKRKKAKERAAKYDADAELLSVEVINGMKAHGITTFTHKGWTTTYSQAEGIEYDAPEIIANLTPAQRREVCKEMVDLNALPADVRKAVIAALGGLSARKQHTKVTLDVGALSRAVTAGKVPLALVSRFSKKKTNKPYISHSGPKKAS